ncbi:hypothetical protein Holit_01618 [Hollandina sp. SP2]
MRAVSAYDQGQGNHVVSQCVGGGDSETGEHLGAAGDEEGEKKQDCELAAGKRWLTRYGEAYRWLKPTLLGDDLYSHEPFCRQVQEAGYSFIFTCKDTTYPWLRETVSNREGAELSRREWNGRHHVAYTYRWVKGVAIRYEENEGGYVFGTLSGNEHRE